MIKKNIIPALFFILLIGNRAISQAFNFGGIYFYEVLLAIALATKPKSIFRSFIENYPAAILIIYTFIILITETISYGFSSFSLRRAALGIYIITPVVINAFHSEIKIFLTIYFNYIIFLLLFFSIFQFGGFHATMAAQLTGALIIFEFINNKINKRTYILIAIFLILVSGITTGESVYRTPIVTTAVAATIAFFSRKNKFNTLLSIVIFFYTVFLVLLIFLSGALNNVIGGILIGLSGLFDSSSLMDIGESLGGDISTSRGSAGGTTKTRMMFWQSIFDYQSLNIKSFIFGYGLQHGFMEVTLPGFPFIDKPLTDPHNSFLNLFFRFGIIGVTLYLWSIFKVYKKLSQGDQKNQNVLPFFIISIMFASFEVVLENPHGSIIFWFIIFIPSFLIESQYKNSRIATSAIIKKQIENAKHS